MCLHRYTLVWYDEKDPSPQGHCSQKYTGEPGPTMENMSGNFRCRDILQDSESGLSKKTKARGNVTDLSSLGRRNNTFERSALNWILGQTTDEGWWESGWVPERVWSCYSNDSFLGFMSAKTHHVSNDDLELLMKQEHRLEAHEPFNLCSKWGCSISKGKKGTNFWKVSSGSQQPRPNN